MVDFVKAANDGIKAHQNVAREKALIARTLQDLLDQLRGQFGSELSVSLKKRTRKVKVGTAVDSALDALSMFTPLPRMTYQSVKPSNESQLDVPYTAFSIEWGEKSWELCRWQQEGGGFPIKLRYDGKEVTCRDQRTFEGGLVDLLASASAGEAFAAIQSLSANAKSSQQSTDS